MIDMPHSVSVCGQLLASTVDGTKYTPVYEGSSGPRSPPRLSYHRPTDIRQSRDGFLYELIKNTLLKSTVVACKNQTKYRPGTCMTHTCVNVGIELTLILQNCGQVISLAANILETVSRSKIESFWQCVQR